MPNLSSHKMYHRVKHNKLCSAIHAVFDFVVDSNTEIIDNIKLQALRLHSS